MELGLYKHYKGNLYEVIGVAQHSETLEQLVVYKATYQKDGAMLYANPELDITKEILKSINNK